MFSKLVNINAWFDLAHIASLADEMHSYSFGDVAVFYGKTHTEKSLLIVTHTDKSTFVCTEICGDGTAKASLLGNFDPKSAAFSYAVSANGTLAAVTVTGNDDSPEFILDFGIGNKAETEKHVSVGEVFHAENTVRRFSENVASGAGLSVTAPTLVLANLCEILADNKPDFKVYVAFLKEGSLYFGGYNPVALALKPTNAVCVGAMDITSAPNLKLGIGGVVRMSDKSYGSDKPMSDSLISAGGVPAVLTKGACAASKVQAVGVPSSELDIPVKNLGTHTELIDLGDVCRCSEILAQICR